MGKRGPKATPNAILKLRKSWRANRRGADIKLSHEKPQRPQWLQGEAKKLWDRLIPDLHKAGLATELYRESLVLLCTAWADFVEAEQQLAKIKTKDGSRALLIKTAAGTAVENPLLYIRKRAWDQIYKAAACFGLTPADLSGVRAVEKPAEKEEKLKYFKGA